MEIDNFGESILYLNCREPKHGAQTGRSDRQVPVTERVCPVCVIYLTNKTLF